MKKLLTIVLLSLCFAAHAHRSAGSPYKVENGQVFHHDTLMAEADSETFGTFNRYNSGGFAKDKNYAYFQGEIINGADPATFEGYPGYGKDKNQVYYVPKEGLPILQILPHVDVASFQAIGNNYYKDKHAVYYEGKALPELDIVKYTQREFYIWDKKVAYFKGNPIEQVDAQTFTTIHAPGCQTPYLLSIDSYEYNFYYAKDKNTVYLEGQIIPDAKGSTFKMIGNICGKDDAYVYCCGKKMAVEPDVTTFTYITKPGRPSGTLYYKDKNQVYLYSGGDLHAIEGADPDSFSLRGHGYAVDNHFVYFWSKKIEGSHAVSFSETVHSQQYVKDKNQVYYEGEVLPHANPGTFEQMIPKIDSYYGLSIHAGKDHQHVYHEANIVEGADVASFEFMDLGYGKDKNFIYYILQPIKNADLDTFARISETDYFQDKSSVFYKGIMLPDSDPKSFRVLKSSRQYEYTKDDKQVYFEGAVLPGADAASFELIGLGYAKDKNIVYYKSKPLENSDPDTFVNIEQTEYYHKDKFTVYYKGSALPDCDSKSFRLILDKGFLTIHSRDDKQVYYQDKVILGADLDSFRLIDFFVAKDKNYIYVKGERAGAANPEKL